MKEKKGKRKRNSAYAFSVSYLSTLQLRASYYREIIIIKTKFLEGLKHPLTKAVLKCSLTEAKLSDALLKLIF